jgi:hypothetical protein
MFRALSFRDQTSGNSPQKSSRRKAKQRFFICWLQKGTCLLVHCWRVAGPATETGGEPPPLHGCLDGGSRAPRPKRAESLRPSMCGHRWSLRPSMCGHRWRVAGPATETGGEPPPLHVRALLEGRGPRDRNGRRASAPPCAGIAGGSLLFHTKARSREG